VGWGRWPLEYFIKLKLPKNAYVYYTTQNLVSSMIEDSRPILIFKDRTTWTNYMNIDAMYLKDDLPAVENTIVTCRPDNVHMKLDIKKQIIESQIRIMFTNKNIIHNKYIDVKFDVFSTISNYGNIKILSQEKPLNFKYLLIPLGDEYKEVLRIYYSKDIINNNKLDIVILSEVQKDKLISQINADTYRLELYCDAYIPAYEIMFIFPENTTVLPIYPQPNKCEIINDERVKIVFNKSENILTPIKIIILYVATKHPRFIVDVPCLTCLLADKGCKNISEIISQLTVNFDIFLNFNPNFKPWEG
jgi:hypothetical protein